MYRSARFLRLAVGLALLHSLTLSAASVWFGDKHGLHRIDTSTNQIAAHVAFEPAVAIAANAADGSIWALSRERLAHLSEQGAVLAEVALRDLGTGLGAPRLLVLNPNDGSVWAGFENRVLHLDAAGAMRHELAVRARDLAVAQDGSLWILTDSALQQHDSSGALLHSAALAGAQRFKNLGLDDAGGVLWLAGEKDVVQLRLSAPGQTSLAILAPETTAGISVDMQTGDLWAIGQNGLFSYSRSGTPRVSRDLRDFSIANPQTLVFDFASQAAWVGHQGGLTRITAAGTVAATFPGAPHVVTIAIGRTPVSIVPVVSIAAPADGALLNTATPELRVVYDALCGTTPCGFPKSFFSTFTLSALLNGNETGSLFVFDPATGGAALTPATPLPEGLNTFTAQARDSFGRLSETVSSSFTVDTIAPSFGNVTPTPGGVIDTASITIAGTVDDSAATVTLGGQTQGAQFHFPVTLVEGLNTFTLVVRDPAGNTASLALTYTYEPPNVPPSAAITSPLHGASFTAPASFVVTANATDSDGSIVRVEFFNNGMLVATDTSAPYAAELANLSTGSYVLVAQATDNRGGVATSAPVSVTVGPPNALPVVQMIAPANTLRFPPASVQVEATASDPDGTVTQVEILRNGTVEATLTAAPYTATLVSLAAGTYSLTARATDDRGGVSTSAPVTLTITAPSITIDSPLPNASIVENNVIVRGRIVAPAYSGVVVNGKVAAVDAAGNYAAHIGLQAGTNAIEATLTMPDRTTVTQTSSFTSSGQILPFSVNVTPMSGFAPLLTAFDVTNPYSVNASFTLDGIGPFFLPAGSTVRINRTWSVGVWTPTVIIRVGTSAFPFRVVIDARDKSQTDQMLRSFWSEMNSALAAGDKDKAMLYLTEDAQAKYGPVFTALLPYMSEIVASYSTLEQVSLTDSVGEYALTRMDGALKRLYLVHFVRDGSGVWRVAGM